MPTPDLSVTFTDTRNDAQPQRDGTVLKTMRYTFYIGKFGPFVERVPLDNFDPNAITARVNALKLHLQQLPT